MDKGRIYKGRREGNGGIFERTEMMDKAKRLTG